MSAISNLLRVSTLLVVLPAILTFGCSRAATCAFEGCKNNNSVSISNNTPVSSSDSVVAHNSIESRFSSFERELLKKLSVEKDETDGQIEGLSKRLAIVEALGAVHSETLALHQKRLAILFSEVGLGSDGNQPSDGSDSLRKRVELYKLYQDTVNKILIQKLANLDKNIIELEASLVAGIKTLEGPMQGVTVTSLTALALQIQVVRDMLVDMGLVVHPIDNSTGSENDLRSLEDELADRAGKFEALFASLEKDISTLTLVLKHEPSCTIGTITTITTSNNKTISYRELECSDKKYRLLVY